MPVHEQQDDRLLLRELEQLLEQLERRLVREVQVLEHEAHRLLSRERAHELGDRLVRLALHRVARERVEPLRRVLLERESEQRREKRIERVRLPAERGCELHLQLEPHARLGIGHSESKARAQQLAQRVVGNVLRVRDRPAPRGSERDPPRGAEPPRSGGSCRCPARR